MPLSSFIHHDTAVHTTYYCPALVFGTKQLSGAAGEDGLQHEVKRTLRGMNIRQPLSGTV